MKKILSIAIALGIFVSAASISYASVDCDYDLIYLERGASEVITVSCNAEEDVEYYAEAGLDSEWFTGNNENKPMLRITANSDATLGNKFVLLRGMTTSEFCTVAAFIIDKTAPQMLNIDKKKSGITVSWKATDVGRYQLQYKAAGGKWKTATDFTSKRSYTVTGLTKGKKYSFRVRSVNYSTEWGEIYGDWSKIKAMNF